MKMLTTTRREFLGISDPSSEPVTTASQSEAPDPWLLAPPTGKVKLFVTDQHRKVAESGEFEWAEANSPETAQAIVLNPSQKYQKILGFGAAFSDAACYTFNQLSPPSRQELFRKLFHPSEMSLSVCRTCMGAADSATKLYSYDDGPVDPELSRFSIDYDREYILPILRQAREVNPDLFLFSSPWSPPGWMKSNGSMLGGCMRHTYMPSYANYFLKFLRAYEAEGVPIQAVTVQNEVDTDEDGTMPACAWPQDYEADFVIQHLGPLFERSGIHTKIWMLDHNYNLWGRALCELETPDVLKYSNAIAWHGYFGQPEWVNRVQDAFPQAEMYWTEGNSYYLAPDYLTDWANWGKTFTTILRNCCRCITLWNFATNEHGRPYIGTDPHGIGGAMLIDSGTKKISYGGIFWALVQFSRFIHRGAIRIDSQSVSDKISHCAFQNPDGSLAIAVTNPNGSQKCEVRLGNKSVKFDLAQNSVTTVTWVRDAGA